MALLITTAKTLRSQNAPHSSSDADHTKHVLAINLLRAINTAELEYKMNHGGYAARDVLLASQEFKGRRFVFGRQERVNVPVGDPQIPPGWSLRLNVASDGKSYDALLEDTTDTTCGYAAVTDERGIIRQSKAIDCAI